MGRKKTRLATALAAASTATSLAPFTLGRSLMVAQSRILLLRIFLFLGRAVTATAAAAIGFKACLLSGRSGTHNDAEKENNIYIYIDTHTHTYICVSVHTCMVCNIHNPKCM